MKRIDITKTIAETFHSNPFARRFAAVLSTNSTVSSIDFANLLKVE